METQYIVLIIMYLSTNFGLSKLFAKAGEPSWKAWVPFLNYVVWIKLLQRPWWWIFILVAPGVNFLMLAIMSWQLAKAFGKKETKDLTLAALFGFVYLPWIGLEKDLKYVGPEDESKIKKSLPREWTEAILFAVVAASVIRTFFLEAFTIPTSSLEKTLMIGDYLFVSKVSYGAKVPNTPLSFPFAHHTLPFTATTKSYLEWLKFPYLRLPGLGKVERNDLVVFNYPDGDTVALNMQDQSYYQLLRDEAFYFKSTDIQKGVPLKSDAYYKSLAHSYVTSPNNSFHLYDSPKPFGQIIARPPDKRENYIKRCVGVPGDKLELKGSVLYINDKQSYISNNMQHNYVVITDKDAFIDRVRVFSAQFPQYNANMIFSNKDGSLDALFSEEREMFDITEQIRYFGEDSSSFKFLFTLPYKNVLPLKGYHPSVGGSLLSEHRSLIKDIQPYITNADANPDRYLAIFPNSPNYTWNVDNFGPLTIPKKGVTVTLDTTNIVLYDRIIGVYENNKLEIKNGKIFINGIESNSYTFKMDYFFMMGDNRHNSADSRYWGFVPEDHIVGKAVFVWMSLKDQEHNGESGKFKLTTFFTGHGKARWNRFMTFVSSDGLSRSYLPHFLVIVAGIYGYNYWRRRKRK